jgi:phage shock protein A
MGMFSRMTDIINANINSMLDKAEHPEKMIRLIIGEMEETLVEVRSAAAKNIAERKGLQRQINALQNKVQQWHEKAELALSKDREDLARSALVEKASCVTKADDLSQQLTVIDDNLAAIQQDSKRLQDKLIEARRRKESMLVRQQSAQVRLKAKEQMATHNIDQAIAKFELYQQKIDEVEAEVEAFDMTASDLQSQFDALQQSEQVEEELAAMKKKVANA